MAETQDAAEGIANFLSNYGVIGVLAIGLLTYITTWLLERGENKAKIGALEDSVKDYKDWKENIDRQMGALTSVPETLESLRRENREGIEKVSEKIDALGNRISTVEGKLDAAKSG